MKNNWGSFSEQSRKEKEAQVFGEYAQSMKTYLQNVSSCVMKNIRRKVPEFAWARFNELVKSRKGIVDEQILDTLMSLEDLEHFKAFIKDYRNSFEEEEMFKVLSVKSNKISELKKVKGKSHNIFAQGENQHDFFEKGLKGNTIKRKPAQEKTEDELLVPNLLLTIKPLRKK